MRGVASAVDAVVNAHELPAVTVMVTDADRIIHCSHHAGAVAGDVWRLYSMTKLIGVIAALKLCEAGHLSLSQPVGDFAPEFDQLQVLEGFRDGVPHLRGQQTRATISDLAHHRAGAVYGVWHDGINRFMRHKGLRGLDDSSVAGLCSLPLAFDPGTAWGYGTGIDWLGLIIERATGAPVEDFVKREVFAPAGAADLFFDLAPELRPRLRPAHQVGKDGFAPLDMTPGPKREFYPMGSALFGTPEAYLAVLRALLRPGALLSPETTRALAEPSSVVKTPLASTHKGASADVDILPGVDVGYALGGLIALENVPGRRRKGAFGWAGMQNTHFWVDPASGIAAVIMMQHLPFADSTAMAALSAFEKAVYAAL
ncbi:MAG: serine hydrolase domain-containing protein [Pikeienuella sp.]